jgi:Tol biopolymer transport system component
MGKIAYQLIDGIALINSDGSNQKMLVNDNLSNYFQSWSSSHQRLFYTARIPPRQDVIEKVFSIKIDGSEIEPIEILGGNGIRSIEISPDGKKVIASSGDWGGLPAILYIGDFDGKSVSHLVRLHDGSIPSWSPDGSKIVFASSPQYPQRYSIYTINPDGTHLINLSDKTNTKADSLWPAWSPDGTKIAFSSDRDGNRLAIYVMDSDGTNVMKLNENGQHPAFSPDGKKIAFIHDQEIYIMNSDGTEIVPLTSCDPYGGLIWVP